MFPVQGPPWGLALRLVAVLCLFACPRIGVAAGPPTISGYAATNPRGVAIFSAPPGALLLIEGANLGASGTVAFGGIPAPLPAGWSPTEILVTVPAAVSYPFKGPVTVTTNGQTASGPEFTITPPPPSPTGLRPGDLDPSFGAGGKVLTDSGWMAENAWGGFGDQYVLAHAMVLQPDGRIVVAGGTRALPVKGKTIFALARYNVNGSLDTTFGTGGQVLTDFGGDDDVAQAVALQPDGRIVVAGFADNAFGFGGREFALARYNADGSLDTTFGTDGMVLTGFSGDYALAFSMAVQPDGQIVAAGAVFPNSGSYLFALARYNVDGSLDNAFGINGTVLTAFGGSNTAAYGYALALQPDGRMVVAGDFDDRTTNHCALARYNANGSLDPSFGSGGKVVTDFPLGSNVSALALQPDGKIVAAVGYDEFALARFNVNGSLDTTFGIEGKVLTDFGGVYASTHAVALQPDGQIIVAGGSNDALLYNDITTNQFTLARYNRNGSLDTTFGAGGKVRTSFGGAYTAAHAVAVQPDGQIVAVGVLGGTQSELYFALARYQGR